MSDPFHESSSLHDAQRLFVEALGEPGKRRFRMLVVVQDLTYIVWMEKQQLQALGMAIEQIFEHIDDDVLSDDSADAPVEFDLATGNQFRLGKVELGVEDGSERIVIAAYDIQEAASRIDSTTWEVSEDDDEDGDPVLRVRLTRRQALYISSQAEVLAAAGRPRCSMCGAPMDPEGHVCPEQNGHLPLSIETDDVE